jgi:hypothetical protein
MWYRYAKHPKFSKLELEALKYDDFDKFQTAYLQGHHGRYWHITDKEDFQLDPQYAPGDTSSMASGKGNNPGLMVTPHLDQWIPQLGENRKHAIEVDLSELRHPTDYYSHNRGFGREIFISKLEGLKHSNPIPISNARRRMNEYYRKLPSSAEQLREVYNKAWEKFNNG